MNAAFIINLDLPDTSDLAGVAEDIKDSVASDGYGVISCQPWARPSMDMSSIAEPIQPDPMQVPQL